MQIRVAQGEEETTERGVEEVGGLEGEWGEWGAGCASESRQAHYDKWWQGGRGIQIGESRKLEAEWSVVALPIYPELESGVEG